MEDNDSFGDVSLFEEFEKDREQRSSFIKESDGVANYKNHNSGNIDESQTTRSGQTCEENQPSDASHSSPPKSATAQYQTKDDLGRLLRPRLSSPSPAIQVLFTDSHLSRIYQSEILSFIGNLLTSHKDDESSSSGKFTSKNSVKLAPSKDEGGKVIGCAHLYKEFFMDLLGWPLVDYMPALTDSWDIPTYEQVFNSCLPYDADDEAVASAKRRASCFNCDGDHNLSECPQPKDNAKIGKRIREFKASKGGGGNRYNIECDPRFASFKPGIYSETLTKALGMRPSQLPLFIYRMRMLGYPPGHLKDAELNTSGIAMFDKHGKEVTIDGDTMEEGEVDDKNDDTDTQFDVTKIIEYPGFNVPVPDHISDDWRALNLPPMNISQSKQAFEEMIKFKKEIKETRGRKRQQIADASKNAKRARIEADMDTANSDDEAELNKSFRPPLPVETPPRTPMAPPLPVNTPPVTPRTPLNNPPLPNNTPPVTPVAPPLPKETPPPTPKFTLEEEGSPASPEDANNQHGAVMKEIPLDSVDSQSDSESASGAGSNVPSRTTSTADVTDLEEQRSSLLKQLEQMEDDDSLSNSVDSSQLMRYSTPVTNRSMSVDLGTPIPQADSHAGLPSFDKFAVGIADHIPFENLPNSTGTYSKLQDVIKQSRVSKNK